MEFINTDIYEMDSTIKIGIYFDDLNEAEIKLYELTDEYIDFEYEMLSDYGFNVSFYLNNIRIEIKSVRISASNRGMKVNYALVPFRYFEKEKLKNELDDLLVNAVNNYNVKSEFRNDIHQRIIKY